MRAILQDVYVLALTATASLKAQQEIKDLLNMKNAAVISMPPDRPNVFLKVHKRLPVAGREGAAERSVELILRPQLERLKHEGSSYPKTIIYLPLQWCGWGHNVAQRKYGLNTGSLSDIVLTANIAQYHAPQTDEMKKAITHSMRNSDSHLRLLLATEAYGMGADVPDIRKIIHTPATIETFVQEIGRAGRDGQQSSSDLYYNSSDIASNQDHISEDIRAYCRLETCRRKFLVEYFGYEHQELDLKHLCCDNCVTQCDCAECGLCEINVDDDLITDELPRFPKEVTIAAEQMLLMYFNAENAIISQDFVIPETITGLSTRLAKALASHAHIYKSYDMLQFTFPHISKHYLEQISVILEAACSLE